ncbi:hypothetical protein FRB90_004057 [Tulasnella sp. 427]|nr:hypothetical protein FRB90_004057 [Tulasnella sp. 427]
MPRSAQKVVLTNAVVSSIVWLVQVFAPNLLYDGHVSKWVSRTAGLRHPGALTPEREPMHGVLACFHLAILVHIWSSALSSRPHAHVGTALMELTYALSAGAMCALFPKYGSGVALFGAVPNFLFAVAICRAGGFGVGELVAMLRGDVAVASVDSVGRRKELKNSVKDE